MEWNYLGHVSLAVLGYVVTNYLNRKSRIAERRIDFLTETYTLLEKAFYSEEKKDYQERKEGFETAISRIQLMGSKNQVDFAKQLSEKIAKNGTGEADILLNMLRASLRKDLNLSEIDENIHIFRFVK